MRETHAVLERDGNRDALVEAESEPGFSDGLCVTVPLRDVRLGVADTDAVKDWPATAESVARRIKRSNALLLR